METTIQVRQPWNKGLIVGQKRPLLPRQVWSIRVRLEMCGSARDLALFNLEADYTVLIDVSGGDYGVPSRIEDDELLHLVIPEPEIFPYAEERRLFYVALTRASRGVFMLTNEDQPSRYIDELAHIAGREVRFEGVDGQALPTCPRCSAGYLVERRSKKRASFMGCSRYPECKHTSTRAN